MAFLEIPLTADRNYEQFTELSGREYQLRVQWNDRGGYFAFSMMAQDGTPLIMGVPLYLGVDILRRFRFIDGLPPGVLFLVDSTGSGVDAGITDLGSRVTLNYEDENL